MRAHPTRRAELVQAICMAEDILDEALPAMPATQIDPDRLTLRSVAFSHLLHELLTFETET